MADHRSLREIALATGTDKELAHSYSDMYERHLGHLRNRPIKLLEIGIGGYAEPDEGGASLRMWKTFFPLAEVFGIDIFDKSALADDRITILRGNQADEAFLKEVAASHGPFDVIIDDGSHICAHVIKSFRVLFEHLASDGIYAIEDLQTSYWERGYGGSSERNRAKTSMTMLKTLVDGLNYAEFDVANYEPTIFDTGIVSVSFYHNLAFIQKGANTQPSNVLAPHPRPETVYRVPPPAAPRPSTARRMFRGAVPRQVRVGLLGMAGSVRSIIRGGRRGSSDQAGPTGPSDR